MSKVTNASSMPEVYYGMHMVAGAAEYKDPTVNNGEPYRILVREDAIKNMNPSFSGRPVFVNHVDNVNLPTLEQEADGYVAESFFNKSDGKCWVKFIVVTDRAKEAIRKGWKLSNAYHIKKALGGGFWNAIQYKTEVLEGVYEHLAIVERPRYEESIIMTPEEFKAYNEQKEAELFKLANSKQGAKKPMKSIFEIFKREKVENSADLEQMVVVLPKSKREATIAHILNYADAMYAEEAEKKEEKNDEADGDGGEVMANGEHMVDCGPHGKMTVNQLVEKHKAIMDAIMSPDEEEGEEPAKDKKPEAEEKKPLNEEPEKKDEKKEEGEKKQNAAHFNELANAEELARIANANAQPEVLEIAADMVKRGQQRYGSN